MKKIKELNPDVHNEMEKALSSVKDPAFKEMLTNVWKNVENSDLYKEAEEVKDIIINAPQRPEQLIFSFLPHEMAKLSIFFPMSDRELKKKDRNKIEKFEIKTGWGKIEIEGIKLAIFEEDVFLVITHLIKNNLEQFKKNFILETDINNIVNLLYGRKGYSKNNRDVILNSLKRIKLVSFNLIFGNWKKNDVELKKLISMSIIQDFVYDENSKILKIYFDPRFVAYFFESMLTNINFTLRRKLKKDGSKALFKFLIAHNQPSRMHILTVLNAINYNTNQPMKYLRRKIKQFISELKANGVLGIKTKLYADDTVYFDVLPFKKALPD